MAKLTTALLVLFYTGFAVYSLKVKRDVARSEGFDRFRSGLPYGYTPPDFELLDVEGSTVALDRVVEDGDLTLINFWATWCPPCRLELPMLDDLQERYGERGLRIVAIDVGEDLATVEAFLRDRDLSFPVLMDTDRSVATRYRIRAFPTTILLDGDGKVVDVTEGLHPYLGYRIEMHLQPSEPESDSEAEQ